MAAWADFIPLVLPHVPGCPELVAEAAARQAAIEFCQRTLALQRTLATVNTVADQAEYTLTQSGEVIERLLSVKLAGTPLELLDPADVDAESDPASSAAPAAALLTAPMKVTLYPTPATAAQIIKVRAAMRPSQTSVALDDGLFERYAQAIADGALYRLLSTAGRAYANPGLAADHMALYDRAIDEAKEDTFRGNARATRRRGAAPTSWC